MRRLFSHLSLANPKFLKSVVTEATLEDLREMRMGIDEPRNHDLAGAVNALVDGPVFFGLLADPSDLAVLNQELLVVAQCSAAIHADESGMLQKNGHFTILRLFKNPDGAHEDT